ncbi:MAG: hypothetical protein QOE99_2742 [Actinomycetota bacterium]|nr:hypothetical protein [Actinomycetota bacterium]
MRPAARWVSVTAMLAAAGAPGLVSAGPAWADSLATQVDAASWYWAEQTVTAPQAGALPAGTPREASGVPTGDLGVSYTTDVDKVAALGFGLSAVPKGAVFTAFTVTMPLDPAGQQLTSPAATPQLSACAALDPIVDGADPGPLTAAPTQNSVGCVDGKFDAGKSTWTFELSSFATDWAAGAPVAGVVIRSKPGDATQFNYAFLGKKDIKVVADYVSTTTPVAAPAPAAPVDTGSGFVAAPPLDSGTTPVAPLAPVAVPAAPQPQVLPPAAPAVAPATTPVAATTVDAMRPTGAFWLALLGLGALMLLLGLVLGDPMDPIVLDARRRRFADVVRARAAARSTAAAARPATSARARPA